MKILAHAPFIGTTGYANHARSFFCALNKYHTVKVRNFTIGDGWSGMSDTPHDKEPYITDEMKDMLILQTLGNPNKSRTDVPMYGYKGDFKPDVNIILQETNHFYFYDDYEGYTIAFNVYESTRYPDYFFNQLMKFDEIWVPSQWQHDSIIEQGAPSEKVKVVPEGVDIEIFKPKRCPKKVSDKFRFLYFGRWDYRKSTTEVIKAFLKTFKGNDDVELIASVENPYPYDDTRNTVDRIEKYGVEYDNIEYVDSEIIMDNIKFIGFLEREDYINYLQNGHIFLSCARSEGWNLPLIEAISCGTPAIYSDYGAQLQFAEGKGIPVKISHLRPANIADTEVGGEYCEPNFEDLSKQMMDAYKNYEKHKKKASQDAKIIHKEFNWDNVAKIACEVLKNKSFYSIPEPKGINVQNPIPPSAKWSSNIEKYNSSFWGDYYKRINISMDNSSFSKVCLEYISPNDKVLDICSGNGRDSVFFKNNNIDIYSFDITPNNLSDVNFKTLNLEDKKHNLSYSDKFFNSVYARFVLHAIPEILEDNILINTNRVLKDNGLFFIEVRSDKGIVSTSSDPHYRRLININTLEEKLLNLNFEIILKEESDGLSIYQDDDPILIRIIARKMGGIKVVSEDINTSPHIDPNLSEHLLLKTKHILNNNDVGFLLLFGTLLGAYRDNGFIKQDSDIDLGLFYDDKKKIKELIEEGYFAVYGIKFLRDIGDFFCQIQYKTDYLDMYFFEKSNIGSRYECEMLEEVFIIPAYQMENEFTTIKFLDESFSTVNNVERYLVDTYGDWKTPRFNEHAKGLSKNSRAYNGVDDFVFVTTGNLGYMETIEKLVKSLNEFSKMKILVYGVDCDVPFDSPNMIKRRIDPPKHSEHDKWYWKQYACIESLNEGYENFVWLDGDVVVNHNIDTISKHFPMLENYPIPDIHIQSEFFTRYTDHNGVNKTQLFNEKLCELWGIKKSLPYMHICMYVFDKKSKWWFEEIIKAYNEIDLKLYGEYYHWNDEGIDNGLRWKHGFTKHLPVSNFDTSSYDGDDGFTNVALNQFYKFWNEEGPQNFNRIFGYQKIPKDKSDIIYFHGNKDGEISDKMINFIKTKRDNNFYKTMNFYVKSDDVVDMGKIFDVEGSTMFVANKYGWEHAVFHEIYNLRDYYLNREKKINEGDIVVDVGANMGVFNRWAYQEGALLVISFEPDKRYYELLKLNAHPRSILFNAAVSDKVGSIELRESEHFGGSNIFWTPENTQGYEVRTYTLDYLFDTGLIDRIDFLKVDIEGAEQLAFKGISDENLMKVKNIGMEYHHSHLGYNAEIREQFIKRLNGLGFNSHILFLGTNNALQMIYFSR